MPSNASRSPDKLLLRNRSPNKKITFADGIVGAVWNESFITSPNTDYIPRPVEHSTLILRSNYFYGADDYLLWPQPYNEVVCHLGAIRSRPEDEDSDWIMWQAFNERDHFTWPLNDLCVSGFGRLEKSIAEFLSESVSRLLEKSKDKQPLSKFGVSEKGKEYLHMAQLNLEFTFARLSGMPCSKEQANRGWVELQRAWRILDTLWNYLTVYRPRMSGSLPPAESAGPIRSPLVGVFTHDERDAQLLFLAGIPVWLIRPLTAFTDQNILTVVEMRDPQVCVEVNPGSIPLAGGHTGSTQKFLSIETASHQFSLHPDPFEIAAFDSASEKLSQSSSRGTSSGGGLKATRPRHPAAKTKPYPKANPKADKGPNGGKSYQKAPRDNFANWEGSFAPLTIPGWEVANERVDRNSRRSRERERGRRDHGYFFPNPGLFFGVEKEWKAAAFIRQWEHLRNVWTLRIFTKSAVPCTSQEWRDILSLGHISGTNSASGRFTANECALGRVRGLIGDCLKAVGMIEHSLFSATLPREEVELQVVDIRTARKLTWELAELNFRWELQALDRRLYDKRRFKPLQRQEMLLRCFSTQHKSIASVHTSLARTGLASPTFAERLPYLHALWELMHDWPVPKPPTWASHPINPTISPEGDRWERELACFYAQTFFDYFARPAILPHTLSREDTL